MVRPPLVSFLDDAEGDVGKQRRDHTTLWSAFVCRKQEAIRQNSGLQELRDQPRDLTIGDASTNPLHQLVVIDVVEGSYDTLPIISTFLRGSRLSGVTIHLKRARSRFSASSIVTVACASS